MVTLYVDPVFELHDTGDHPENAGRLRAIRRELEKRGILESAQLGEIKSATEEQVRRVHPNAYVEKVRRLAQQGGGRLDPDTVVSRLSHDVALKAAGTACDAVDQVATGNSERALSLIRPPGHHALPDRAMGFCLLNNVAIAARHAQQVFDLERILIVDWDVHHGNGTQDIFYSDPHVVFLSIHRFPFYPGTGDADKTGTGDGLGATFNIPVRFGTSREDYFKLFERGLNAAAERAKPQLVLISAGFDAHRRDPIGSLGLETEDFERLSQLVLSVTNTWCQGKVVSLLEGGYDPQALADSVCAHYLALRGPGA